MAYPTAKSSLASVAALFLGLAFVGGCQKNYNKVQGCTTSDSCQKIGVGQDGAVGSPVCCDNVCVIPNSTGCDTGYRYLTTEPGAGQCVPDAPMCAVMPDQSMPLPVDMTQPPEGDAAI